MRGYRWTALLMALLLLLLAGCRGVGKAPEDYEALVRKTLARDYSFTAEVAYSGTTATVQVVKTGEADLQADFTAPEVLEGLSVTAAGETLTVKYRGTDVDLSAYAIPTQSLMTLLREVLTGEKAGKLTVALEEDQVTASGSILLTTYQLVFDKETMALEDILIPSLEGEVEITEFRFLTEET